MPKAITTLSVEIIKMHETIEIKTVLAEHTRKIASKCGMSETITT